LCFDLKGSIAGRKTLDKPEILLNQNLDAKTLGNTYK